jgi:hypothetical protein
MAKVEFSINNLESAKALADKAKKKFLRAHSYEGQAEICLLLAQIAEECAPK